MIKHQSPKPQFAICINTDDPDLLTPRMVYQVLPDESAARSNYVRVIDNEGEDYLYPADYFIFVDLPRAAKYALLHLVQGVKPDSEPLPRIVHPPEPPVLRKEHAR